MKVLDIMSSRVVTVEMDDRLTLVKEIFDNAPFHHLLVIDEEQLTGVISERDLLRAISPNLGANETTKDVETLQKRVHQIMTREPITVAPHLHIDDASALLLKHEVGCLPVLENNQLIGVVTWKDLLKAQLEQNSV